jgi:hypothetical protein
MEEVQVLQATRVSEGTIRHKFPIQYTTLGSVSNTQTVFLLDVAPMTLIVGVLARLVTQFQATSGLNLCTVMVGATGVLSNGILDTTVTSLNYYLSEFSCTQNVSSTSFMYWTPLAMFTSEQQRIQATFTSTGAFLSTLTAGEVELTIIYRSL